jgi:hypothetical protein
VRVFGRELHCKARIRVLDREREQVAAESGRYLRGLEELRLIEIGVRNRVENSVNDGRYPGELSSRLRDTLWIDEHRLPPGGGGGEKHVRRRLIRGSPTEGDRNGRCRHEKDDQQEDKLPSPQDPQVIKEARDDRPIGGMSARARHWAASSRARWPENHF